MQASWTMLPEGVIGDKLLLAIDAFQNAAARPWDGGMGISNLKMIKQRHPQGIAVIIFREFSSLVMMNFRPPCPVAPVARLRSNFHFFASSGSLGWPRLDKFFFHCYSNAVIISQLPSIFRAQAFLLFFHMYRGIRLTGNQDLGLPTWIFAPIHKIVESRDLVSIKIWPPTYGAKSTKSLTLDY